MKNNGFHASTTGGKKLFAVVLIMALVLAAIPAFSVFAAPGQPPIPTGSNSATVSPNQMRELQQAQTWFNNFRSQPGQFSNSAKIQQYLDQYAFALRQANTILAGGQSSTGQNNNNNSNGQSSNQTGNNFTVQQNMGWWLHMMRGLRDKIAAEGGPSANSTFNNNAGIPVTGGSSSNNGSSTTNNSGSSSSNNSGSTTTNSGSTATNNSGTTTTNSTVNNTSLAQTWGPQFRELQAAQVWFNNFKSQPGKIKTMSDQAKVQQYLDQYAFALRQANAVIAGGITSNGPQNSFDQGLTNSQSDRTAAQQQLAIWLHMMRSLREKINGFNSTNGG